MANVIGVTDHSPNQAFTKLELIIGVFLPIITTLLIAGWWIIALKNWDGIVAATVFYISFTALVFATWYPAGNRVLRSFRFGWLRLANWIGLAFPPATFIFAAWAWFAGSKAPGIVTYALAMLAIAQAFTFHVIVTKLLASVVMDQLPRTPMLLGTMTPVITCLVLSLL
ncbi:MAG: hypothetical protein CFE31_03280 [Rhizobiales bacterium PAR1]|nr:MAG: hypothetical protein CFE31_03280 [Rhizobiales bacterium PAR1]